MPYEGMKLHRCDATGLVEYEVSGDHLFKYMLATEPEFEIREDQIFPAKVEGASPVYEIRGGRFVHEHLSASGPVYELK